MIVLECRTTNTAKIAGLVYIQNIHRMGITVESIANSAERKWKIRIIMSLSLTMIDDETVIS